MYKIWKFTKVEYSKSTNNLTPGKRIDSKPILVSLSIKYNGVLQKSLCWNILFFKKMLLQTNAEI